MCQKNKRMVATLHPPSKIATVLERLPLRAPTDHKEFGETNKNLPDFFPKAAKSPRPLIILGANLFSFKNARGQKYRVPSFTLRTSFVEHDTKGERDTHRLIQSVSEEDKRVLFCQQQHHHRTERSQNELPSFVPYYIL
jgi:hypothetical protein